MIIYITACSLAGKEIQLSREGLLHGAWLEPAQGKAYRQSHVPIVLAGSQRPRHPPLSLTSINISL